MMIARHLRMLCAAVFFLSKSGPSHGRGGGYAGAWKEGVFGGFSAAMCALPHPS